MSAATPSDPRLLQATKGSTAWCVTVRSGKRGRTRSTLSTTTPSTRSPPGSRPRPAASSEHLLASLPRTGRPGALSPRDIARIVARHAAAAALPEDRRSPHVLRHAFCTDLADAGVDTAVIRELA